MADAVAGEIDLGLPLGGDPVEDLLALAVRAKAVHLRHPWLAELPPEPLRLGPHGLAYLEFALRAMAPARLPGPARLEVVAVVDALVAQFARAQRQQGAAGADRRAAQAAYLGETAAAGAYPHLAAALAGAPEATRPRTRRRCSGGRCAGSWARCSRPGLLTDPASGGTELPARRLHRLREQDGDGHRPDAAGTGVISEARGRRPASKSTSPTLPGL